MVSRFCDDNMNNRVNEEYSNQCMALENVVMLICHLCARYGVLTVVYMSIEELGVLGLLHFGPGAQLFNGRHLLLATIGLGVMSHSQVTTKVVTEFPYE